MYHSKWFPRLFYTKPDGGKDSGVTAYFLIEWKILFSIGILHFKHGARENFHSHAFNACTWFIKGHVTENMLSGEHKDFYPSFLPKITLRSCFHRVFSHSDTFALTFRGPWSDTWSESRPSGLVTLTHGRKEL